MKFQTFLINLERSTSRLSYMSNQLQKLGIEFNLEKAIDGRTHDYSNDFDEVLSKKKNSGKLMSRGNIACSLSHKRIFEKILKENIDYTLVIEDDVDLAEGFKEIVTREVKKRKENITNWDYLSFNYLPTGYKAIISWLTTFKRLINENKRNLYFWLKTPLYLVKFFIITPIYIYEGLRESFFINKNGRSAIFCRPLYLTGCYLLTKDGAKKLLNVNDKIIYMADRLPNIARIKTGLIFRAFVPLSAKQNPLFESETK